MSEPALRGRTAHSIGGSSQYWLLAGGGFPEIAEPDSDLIAGAFVLPQEALAGVAAGR